MRTNVGDEHFDGSAETEEIVNEFQAITGVQDVAQCQELLQAHQWDLQESVMAYLQWQDTDSSADVAQSESVLPSEKKIVDRPDVIEDETDETEDSAGSSGVVRRRYLHWGTSASTPVESSSESRIVESSPLPWTGWLRSFFVFPFRFFYYSVYGAMNFFISFLRPDPRHTATNPLRDVNLFRDYFKDTYGPLCPKLFAGTYSQAINEAKRSLQFLLVYLHGDSHEDTELFCRDTLCHPQVVSFLDSELLFWACNINSAEGYRVSQALREHTYPFLVLIVLRNDRMAVVARLEGYLKSHELLDQLRSLMEVNRSQLQVARARRNEVETSRLIRSMQESEYEKSLRIDQEKEARRGEAEELARAQSEAIALKERLIAEKISVLQRRKELLRASLPAEPAASEPDIVRLQIKLPNGRRLLRRFRCSDSLRHLYGYILCSEEAPDDFQVKRNFPCTELPCQPTDDELLCDSQVGLTFRDVGLMGSEMLFVHDNEA